MLALVVAGAALAEGPLAPADDHSSPAEPDSVTPGLVLTSRDGVLLPVESSLVVEVGGGRVRTKLLSWYEVEGPVGRDLRPAT